MWGQQPSQAWQKKEMVDWLLHEVHTDITSENPGQGLDIEIVKEYKYLGVYLKNKLDWFSNINVLYKKGQSHLYLVMEETGVSWCVQKTAKTILGQCGVCSVLWCGNTVRDIKRINRLVRRVSFVLDRPLDYA